MTVDGLTYIVKVKYGQKNMILQILEKVIAEHPSEDIASANKYLAYVFIMTRKNMTKHFEYFAKVPTTLFDTEDYVKLAQIYNNKKDYDNAYKYFNEELTSDSTDNSLYFMGIKAVQIRKKYDKAV